MQPSDKLLLKLSVVAALTASGGLCLASTATNTFAVTATVSASCTIAATPVAFGSYDPLSLTSMTAVGTIVVTCTKGATGLSVGLSNGNNYVTSTRNMIGLKSDKLAYSLKQPTMPAGSTCPNYGLGTDWTSSPTSLAVPDSTAKAPRTYNVCGQLASGQDVSVDTYSDTVTATLTF